MMQKGGIVVESEVVQLATSQGVWAVLFVCLLFYVLKENSQREQNFQDIILGLTEKLDTLDSIKDDLEVIKDELGGFTKKT